MEPSAISAELNMNLVNNVAHSSEMKPYAFIVEAEILVGRARFSPVDGRLSENARKALTFAETKG